MKTITFIDTEVNPKTARIQDIGGVNNEGQTFHENHQPSASAFLQGSSFVCGHNIFHHDLKYIADVLAQAGISKSQIIDTLHWSALLFPKRPYHALLKDEKIHEDAPNNPLVDAQKVKALFDDEVAAFHALDDDLKQILYGLLRNTESFAAFFRYIDFAPAVVPSVEELIEQRFQGQICSHAQLHLYAVHTPIELSYALMLIQTGDRYSIMPRWIAYQYPDVSSVLYMLRNRICENGCPYCNAHLDVRMGLKRFFGFDEYRRYDGKPLQELAARTAMSRESLLALFPTGGGKSVTFQVPALMSGEAVRGLTVVISPLQSLMKDQVDNLERNDITDAVTINGLLDPVERAKAYERVTEGQASLLYISPESLRSKSIETMLLERNVVRFVIDEAHCFSSWGQDFRVDYLYIADFIRNLQLKKQLQAPIPISCFTATAKPQVVADILRYFKDQLNLELKVFSANTARTNLHYKVFAKNSPEEKYTTLRSLLEIKKCPTIVYTSRTKRAADLAERLAQDGFRAKPYHGKMDKQEKTSYQNDFIAGDLDIIVATSAFGMGVDKKDVGMVIHYDISDSLENYVQEAGRAGRDPEMTADCYVLFDEQDLDKHFILLNQTKLSIKEIKQIWKAIKDLTRWRKKISNSALEIARKAGWDDTVAEIETRVKTAISALENAGYLKRGQNMPRIYANSILTKTAQEALERIAQSDRFSEEQKTEASRVIRKLFSSKSKFLSTGEEAESRVDFISDHLGIVKERVIEVINLMRDEKILADNKDLTVDIKTTDTTRRVLNTLNRFAAAERFLLKQLTGDTTVINLKELNDLAETEQVKGFNPRVIKILLNLWSIKHWIKRNSLDASRTHFEVTKIQQDEWIQQALGSRHELAKFIVEFLLTKYESEKTLNQPGQGRALIQFSVQEIKEAFQKQSLFLDGNQKVLTYAVIEDAIFYLSRIEALTVEGGFMVVYNGMTIQRLEEDNLRNYRAEDYRALSQFYENKVQQIHVVGEYARKMLSDYSDALGFVDDYFQMDYGAFLAKHFKGKRGSEIKRNITPQKFEQLFGTLSPAQLSIINDKQSPYILVIAGPGSGKTKVLVHKLASLFLMEDYKHEQMLMLTFSRAAVNEFKKRLHELIGNAAYYVEIKTFHAYCFDLLGKVGNLDRVDDVIPEATERIRKNEVEIRRVTKSVLVIDEAQDLSADEWNLVHALMDCNEDMRVIAVGDDDQLIYEFRGADIAYLKQFINREDGETYELIDNYRSRKNIIAYANGFVRQIKERLKQNAIQSKSTIDGQVIVTQYASKRMVVPMVEQIRSHTINGTCCVLTMTNAEAFEVMGLLQKNKISARLIQSNDGFNLMNLVEVRYFVEALALENVVVIRDEQWKQAKDELQSKYARSSLLPFCNQMIREFELVNPERKYKSDLDSFIREAKMEDFAPAEQGVVWVSTIHKAKGKEFDQVYLMLKSPDLSKDETKRKIYVGMTRAKQDLFIHTNIPLMPKTIPAVTERQDRQNYDHPEALVLHLSLRDVVLDFFMDKQGRIQLLMSGDSLRVDSNGCKNAFGQPVLRFSKAFVEKLGKFRDLNYEITSARVNMVLYWKKDETEYRVLLPEIQLKRRQA